jgi:hypothetical protein
MASDFWEARERKMDLEDVENWETGYEHAEQWRGKKSISNFREHLRVLGYE